MKAGDLFNLKTDQSSWNTWTATPEQLSTIKSKGFYAGKYTDCANLFQPELNNQLAEVLYAIGHYSAWVYLPYINRVTEVYQTYLVPLT